MPPKAENQPKETSGKKKGKKKTKADLFLNNGATTTVVGGGSSTAKDRKVKQKYEDGNSLVSSYMSNMPTKMNASTCSYSHSPNQSI